MEHTRAITLLWNVRKRLLRQPGSLFPLGVWGRDVSVKAIQGFLKWLASVCPLPWEAVSVCFIVSIHLLSVHTYRIMYTLAVYIRYTLALWRVSYLCFIFKWKSPIISHCGKVLCKHTIRQWISLSCQCIFFLFLYLQQIKKKARILKQMHFSGHPYQVISN